MFALVWSSVLPTAATPYTVVQSRLAKFAASPMVVIPVARARVFGLIGIVGIALLQAFNSFACYGHDLPGYLGALAFIAVPMAPALIVLFTKNPLRAIAASLLFAPWLAFAYYTDCIRPYQGGGASMIYVAVLMYGLPCTLAGALLGGPVLRGMGISTSEA